MREKQSHISISSGILYSNMEFQPYPFYGAVPTYDQRQMIRKWLDYLDNMSTKRYEKYINRVDGRRRYPNESNANGSGFIYLAKDGSGLTKIGRTKNVEARIKSHQTSSSTIRLIKSYTTSKMNSVESDLHKMFAEKRKHREWFDLSATDIDAIDSYFIASGEAC